MEVEDTVTASVSRGPQKLQIAHRSSHPEGGAVSSPVKTGLASH